MKKRLNSLLGAVAISGLAIVAVPAPANALDDWCEHMICTTSSNPSALEIGDVEFQIKRTNSRTGRVVPGL